jgi:hypothetical protein
MSSWRHQRRPEDASTAKARAASSEDALVRATMHAIRALSERDPARRRFEDGAVDGRSSDEIVADLVRVVDQQLAGGARLDVKVFGGGSTLLMVAASFGCVEVVRLLLQRGADPERRNASGESAASISTMLAAEASMLRAQRSAERKHARKDRAGRRRMDDRHRPHGYVLSKRMAWSAALATGDGLEHETFSDFLPGAEIAVYKASKGAFLSGRVKRVDPDRLRTDGLAWKVKLKVKPRAPDKFVRYDLRTGRADGAVQWFVLRPATMSFGTEGRFHVDEGADLDRFRTSWLLATKQRALPALNPPLGSGGRRRGGRRRGQEGPAGGRGERRSGAKPRRARRERQVDFSPRGEGKRRDAEGAARSAAGRRDESDGESEESGTLQIAGRRSVDEASLRSGSQASRARSVGSAGASSLGGASLLSRSTRLSERTLASTLKPGSHVALRVRSWDEGEDDPFEGSI